MILNLINMILFYKLFIDINNSISFEISMNKLKIF
jgi:hypothetical protein